MMIFRTFKCLPAESAALRNRVFVEEQGFTDEFDYDDKNALHIVGYDENGNAVANCRLIKRANGEYLIGRVAVAKERRGEGIGAAILREAEMAVAENGGGAVFIHSQLQAEKFYLKSGYIPTGESDFEQGCPHVMLKKTVGKKD